MDKKSKVLLITLIALIALLAGAFAVVLMNQNSKATNQSETNDKSFTESGVRTFADWTDEEVFQTVPAMIVDGTRIDDAKSYGAENYVINVAGTQLSDYQEYLRLLEQEGYTKYVDNGETGLEEAVYNTTYTKGALVVTVTHIVKMEKTYISVCENLPLSTHLFYQEEYVSDIKTGAKTTLHMLELYNAGNSFLIQLKNGHFIMNDGGDVDDLPYLLDYMESLVPEGEKPVIEAWILTHAHDDHMGIFEEFTKDPEYSKRIYVEGVYYNEIDANTATKVGGTGSDSMKMYLNLAVSSFKTTSGEKPKVYRPQMGQRYYFCDVVIEIPFAQEQLIVDNYYVEMDNLNDSSTWCMYLIDGQKFMLCGDASRGSMQTVMRTYESDYFQVDVYATFHHGINSWEDFIDFMSAKTVLFTYAEKHTQNPVAGGDEGNEILIDRAVECYAWGDGAVVLTFPYKVGTAKIQQPNEWKYHEKREPSWLENYPEYKEKYTK